ncbi:hypothetical protein [Sandarakinorhabdus sp.]|uniref:hypothetical protein n=1 Tax=Sandarakinorhabdus sp. TaxID=1916663 RepID=UPI00286EA0F1|nr:hypothetical protein [Sandarakinorhabdus sp.]
MQPFSAGAIWNDTLAALRRDFWTLFVVAAPFTLLVSMAAALFGPPAPRTMAGYTPGVVFWLIVVPGVIGIIAQLAVVRLVADPSELPRRALGRALALSPVFLLASTIAAVPVALGLMALVVPGLYVMARLFLTAPVAALEGLDPASTVRRSWELTRGHGGTILLFIVLGILFVLGASVLSAGIGAAVASVVKLIGFGAGARFIDALLPSLLGVVLTMGSAAASTVIYRNVAQTLPPAGR